MSPTPARRSRAAAKKAAASPPVPPKEFVPHHLVPPHELLSEAETASTIAALKVSPERLPRILVTDPGLKTDPKYVAAREAREPLNGRLVRIRRPSTTAGEAVAYRLIVSELGD